MTTKTTKEYTLTVKKTIYERLDAKTKAVYKKPGDKMVVQYHTYEKLMKREKVEWTVNAGMGMYASVEFDVSHFHPEVDVKRVTITTEKARLK
jgi:hypothetical protein